MAYIGLRKPIIGKMEESGTYENRLRWEKQLVCR